LYLPSLTVQFTQFVLTITNSTVHTTTEAELNTFSLLFPKTSAGHSSVNRVEKMQVQKEYEMLQK